MLIRMIRRFLKDDPYVSDKLGKLLAKGEAEAGQEELNIKYAAAMDTADYHSIAKHAVKEIAHQHGHAASFMAKWSHERVGSSSHVHQSLWQGGKPAFYDAGDDLGMSGLMKSYVAGEPLQHPG